jgi:hypothetical protein
MELVRGLDRSVLSDALSVHEHVDVGPHPTSLVEDPSDDRRVPSLELPKHLTGGRAGEIELRRSSRALRQRSPERHGGHAVETTPPAAL